MRRSVTIAAVVVLLVVSGCAAPASTPSVSSDADRELGDYGEIGPDTTFEFEGATAEELSDRELEAIKHRSMARIEVLRGLPFEEDVDFEIITREEYREETTWGDEPADPATNERWRGAFVVDGETDVNEEFEQLYGDAVQGYYSGGTVVLVTDDRGTIDRSTLVHELVHALQDQHFGLSREGTTLDAQRAETGLIEGEANYVPILYDERCEIEWQCLPDPDPPTEDPEQRPFNVGLFLSIFAPYSEGPAFVAHLHDPDDEGPTTISGDWSAVDRAYEVRPTSTTQLIHPDRYPDVDPVPIEVEDRSNDEWLAFEDDGEIERETIGEATLFASLWANGVIDRPIDEGGTEVSPFNYSHPITDGWAGDEFVAYHHVTDENRTGHVWELAWESESDAEEFYEAYLALLDVHDAQQVDERGNGADVHGSEYRIPDGDPFAGAYRVTLDGDTVEIVGGPTVDSLEEIRPTESGTASFVDQTELTGSGDVGAVGVVA